MRYTFCAPGAIGKGRGQGLRSLITNGKTLTKCSLSSVYQPNDVVKQYIQEFETRKERDQQKELQTLPCVLLQVMGMTMRKKFVVRENEFMPVNTLLPLSTNEVKPYLKEVVTSSIGKERGKGLTSSSMLSGQVLGTKMHKNSVVCENEYIQFDTPFYPSTNQVKQRTKEAEATIGKGPEGGDVRMGMIRKNSMVLEKEYMQVDTTFSPSTNQVKQRTKEAETIQARSKRNTANRANLTMLHHIGSKPIREIMYQQGAKEGNPLESQQAC
ncbi:uncharacterized protein LOC107868259 isoform X2 [Capsicum annuum]|uniref:uncharacterized protein LOC107868259 isoform X2 n=1 Tax=Capsicum annuum TaxID=4072 RepID=UPI0007BF8D51|nr:uncharacterized protein LOC107868259 isoform X2 [Capsicum annuum]XP_047266705.1 uncharacterized protein LOC107868259 isoform X2 [Capsicum annuum]